jgi:hypothetical protein
MLIQYFSLRVTQLITWSSTWFSWDILYNLCRCEGVIKITKSEISDSSLSVQGREADQIRWERSLSHGSDSYGPGGRVSVPDGSVKLAVSPRVKLAGVWSWSLPSQAEIMNAWSFTSTKRIDPHGLATVVCCAVYLVTGVSDVINTRGAAVLVVYWDHLTPAHAIVCCPRYISATERMQPFSVCV